MFWLYFILIIWEIPYKFFVEIAYQVKVWLKCVVFQGKG
jgi:hypothetical protein